MDAGGWFGSFASSGVARVFVFCAMKPILALRHVQHEGLGLLEDVFRERRLVYHIIDLPADAPQSLDPRQLAGLVVLGGPMNVDQVDDYPFLAEEVRW